MTLKSEKLFSPKNETLNSSSMHFTNNTEHMTQMESYKRSF